jgi:sugar phosphate isomerase/epimerase
LVYGNRWRDARPAVASGADASPWLDHVERMIPDDVERKHVLDVMAFKVQHPNIKINHAVLHGGYVANAAERDSVLPRLVEVASTLHTEAAELGIELMLENLIPDKLGYTHIWASNLPEWQNLITEIGCGAVLDTGHSAASGIGLAEVFDALGHSVRAIHLSDNDEHSDLHLLPGDGHNVTAELPRILTDLGYTGVITYEISPLRYTLRDVLAHIAAAP